MPFPIVAQNPMIPNVQVPQTGVNVIKVPTPKTKKELEEEQYRKEMKEVVEATWNHINNMVVNQRIIIELFEREMREMQVMRGNHDVPKGYLREIQEREANHDVPRGYLRKIE